MMRQVVAFLSLLSVACSAAVGTKPAFCHDLDCPAFTVVESNADYELRRYTETKWVSVQMEAATRDDVNSAMFRSLFMYISGENANNTKIAMTAPVMTTVAHGQGPNCASNFTMHFMIPHTRWAAPLAPTNPKVKLVTIPAMDVYVRSFGGFASDDDYNNEVVELAQALNSKNVQVDSSVYYTAGYDSPYQFINRHNEVWLRKM